MGLKKKWYDEYVFEALFWCSQENEKKSQDMLELICMQSVTLWHLWFA